MRLVKSLKVGIRFGNDTLVRIKSLYHLVLSHWETDSSPNEPNFKIRDVEQFGILSVSRPRLWNELVLFWEGKKKFGPQK